jgi:hypothetical protein
MMFRSKPKALGAARQCSYLRRGWRLPGTTSCDAMDMRWQVKVGMAQSIPWFPGTALKA